MLCNLAEWAVAYCEEPGRLNSHLAEIERRDGRQAMLEVIGIAFLRASQDKNWRARKILKWRAEAEGVELPKEEQCESRSHVTEN
jgi:hypothetical protein